MGVICKKKVCVCGGGGGGRAGGGNNWVIKIFGATNCEVIVALISVSSHPLYTVHAQNISIWVESENIVVRISPVKITVKHIEICDLFLSQKVCVCVCGGGHQIF